MRRRFPSKVPPGVFSTSFHSQLSVGNKFTIEDVGVGVTSMTKLRQYGVVYSVTGRICRDFPTVPSAFGRDSYVTQSLTYSTERAVLFGGKLPVTNKRKAVWEESGEVDRNLELSHGSGGSMKVSDDNGTLP